MVFGRQGSKDTKSSSQSHSPGEVVRSSFIPEGDPYPSDLESIIRQAPGVISPLLDAIQSDGIAIASPDMGQGKEGNRIIYMNRKMHEIVEKMADELRTNFGISPQEVVGGSIHRFHKDPDRIRQAMPCEDKGPGSRGSVCAGLFRRLRRGSSLGAADRPPLEGRRDGDHAVAP